MKLKRYINETKNIKNVPLKREKSYIYPKIYSVYDEIYKSKPEIVIVKRTRIFDPQHPTLKKYYEYLIYELENGKWTLNVSISQKKTKAEAYFKQFQKFKLNNK